MAQYLGPDQNGSLQKNSTSQVQMNLSSLGLITSTIGGQQYASTSVLTLNTGGTGAGGLDTGSLTASTVYYIYFILSSGSLAIVASTSLTAPSGFSSYTFSNYVFYVNSSTQVNNVFTLGNTSLPPMFVGGVNIAGGSDVISQTQTQTATQIGTFTNGTVQLQYTLFRLGHLIFGRVFLASGNTGTISTTAGALAIGITGPCCVTNAAIAMCISVQLIIGTTPEIGQLSIYGNSGNMRIDLTRAAGTNWVSPNILYGFGTSTAWAMSGVSFTILDS